jgi:hypothetical protein
MLNVVPKGEAESLLHASPIRLLATRHVRQDVPRADRHLDRNGGALMRAAEDRKHSNA